MHAAAVADPPAADNAVEVEMRTCRGPCGETKLLTDFGRSNALSESPPRYRWTCHSCRAADRRAKYTYRPQRRRRTVPRPGEGPTAAGRTPTEREGSQTSASAQPTTRPGATFGPLVARSVASPAELLREMLAEDRAAGFTFEDVWDENLRFALDGCGPSWRGALSTAKEQWREAWDRLPPAHAMAVTPDMAFFEHTQATPLSPHIAAAAGAV